MKRTLTAIIRPLVRRAGFDIVRHKRTKDYLSDMGELNIEIYERVEPYTMTSLERVSALIDAVKYVVRNEIDGALVECGVWKGGSSMAMVLTLQRLCTMDREVYLYDTFSGMSSPSDVDVSFTGIIAREALSNPKNSKDTSIRCFSPLEEVKENMFSTGYPKEKIHFVEGQVEETIPDCIPDSIAILRLDTDWYESTKHELAHLFPRLKSNGVLIVDDYGHWKGARKAVDEYISENNIRILLNRIDYTGRIAVKTGKDH